MDGLEDQVTYSVQVTASNEFKGSERSDPFTFEFNLKPVPPKNLRVDPYAEVAENTLILLWDPIAASASEEATYDLYWSVGADYSNTMY